MKHAAGGFISDNCTFHSLDAALLSKNPSFSCGDEDLDDFFLNNSENYNRQLLGKSFCYCLKEKPETIVCAFTLSNSSVDVKNLPNSRRKKLTEYIPFEKRMKNYPSVFRLVADT